VDAKAWYDTVFRIATAVVPAAIQAAQSKGFSPGVHALPADDAEAKAWYDTVLNCHGGNSRHWRSSKSYLTRVRHTREGDPSSLGLFNLGLPRAHASALACEMFADYGLKTRPRPWGREARRSLTDASSLLCVEFLQQVVDVVLHRCQLYLQAPGDLLVRESLLKQSSDLSLACR
jgi:hypothetical protein